MKRLLSVLIIITISTIGNLLYSQTQPQPFSIGIGGLLLEHQYTHEQVVSALGIPQSYKLRDTEIGFGYAREYIFKNNDLHFYDDNTFHFLNLTNSSYKLNGIVGVGDPASKIYDLPHNRIKVLNFNSGRSTYKLFFRNIEVDDMSSISFYVENGIITKIVYLYLDYD